MSDPRTYNYTSANKGTQVDIGISFRTSQTWGSGDTKEEAKANPVDLTNLVLSGNLLLKDGTSFPLVEVVDTTVTGILVNADRTLGQYYLQLSKADSGTITTSQTGIWDVISTDSLLLTGVVLKGKIEFKLTASS